MHHKKLEVSKLAEWPSCDVRRAARSRQQSRSCGGWFHRFAFQECILKYFLEGTTPRVIAERDDAALLTQEGNGLLSLSVSDAESNLDSTTSPGAVSLRLLQSPSLRTGRRNATNSPEYVPPLIASTMYCCPFHM